MLQCKNLIIISGTGVKVGKTNLACSIISFFKELDITAIKITPEFFEPEGNFHEVCIAPQFAIIEEFESSNSNDSRRMKLAGAKHAYFVQCADENIPLIFPFVPELSPGSKIAVVCESVALRNYIQPGLFLMVRNDINPWIGPASILLMNLADKLITYKDNKSDFDISSIKFFERKWFIS